MIVAEATFTAAVVTDSLPNATELSIEVDEFMPIAMLFSPVALDWPPIAIAEFFEATAPIPVAIEPKARALELNPVAIAKLPVASE